MSARNGANSRATRHHSGSLQSRRDLHCQLIEERKDEGVFGTLRPLAINEVVKLQGLLMLQSEALFLELQLS